MSNPLIVEFDADITKLQAKLAIAQQELKRATAGVNRSARTGDVENTAEAIAAREAALAHTAALGKSIAANELALRGFNERARETVGHFERFKGHFEGGALGFLGGGGANLALSGPMMIAAGIAAAVGSAVELGLHAAETAHHIEAMGLELGVSTGQLVAWKKAATEAGVSTELMDRLYQRFAIAASKAAEKQNELVTEGAKLVNVQDGLVARGGRDGKPTKPSAHIVDGGMFLSDEAVGPYSARQLNRLKDANLERVRAGQEPIPLPDLDTLKYQNRARAAENTPEGLKLRENIREQGGTAPFATMNETLDAISSKGKDAFQKLHIEMTDLNNESLKFAEIWAPFTKAMSEQGAVAFQGLGRQVFGRQFHDPLAQAFVKEQGAKGADSVFNTPESEDPEIAAGGEAQKSILQKKGQAAYLGFRAGLLEVTTAIKAIDGVVDTFSKSAARLDKAMADVPSPEALQGFDTIHVRIEDITGAANIAAGAIGKIGAAAAGLAGSKAEVDGAAQSSPFASGGPVRGPGSGTSDSILARLSNGEFVMRAEAVSRIGLSALNRMNAHGFAEGGLVGFAGGGAVGGRAPVHLHLGGNSYALHGDGGVVDALVSEAHRQNMTSAGVKPSWYAGRPSGR